MEKLAESPLSLMKMKSTEDYEYLYKYWESNIKYTHNKLPNETLKNEDLK